MKCAGKDFHKTLYLRDALQGFKYASVVNLLTFVVPITYKKWQRLFLGACRNQDHLVFVTPVLSICLIPSYQGLDFFSLLFFSQSSKFKFSSGKSNNMVFEVLTFNS